MRHLHKLHHCTVYISAHNTAAARDIDSAQETHFSVIGNHSHNMAELHTRLLKRRGEVRKTNGNTFDIFRRAVECARQEALRVYSERYIVGRLPGKTVQQKEGTTFPQSNESLDYHRAFDAMTSPCQRLYPVNHCSACHAER